MRTTYRIQRFSLCAWFALAACSAPEPPVSSRNGQGATRAAPSSVGQAPNAGRSAAGSGGSSGPNTGGPLVKASPPPILGQGKVCASATVQTAKATPTIYFVVDGSGSMCADFGGQTRWNALRGALLDPNKGLVHRLQDSVKFGITLYDGTINMALSMVTLATGGVTQNPPCAILASRTKMLGQCPQLIESPPALNNAMAIDMIYPQQELGGSTPTDRAMAHVMDFLIPMVGMQTPDGKPVGKIFVILATDGAPNDICTGGLGGDGSAQRQGVIAAVDRGAAADITTYVISLAGSDMMLQAHLAEVAKHGNPADPMAHPFSPDNPDDLVSTLAHLLGGALGCNISLSGTVTAGQECQGNVEQNGAKLPCCQQAPGGEWTCNGAPAAVPEGWRLADGHSIELLGDACTRFLIGSGDVLAATFPCEFFQPD